MSFNENDVNRDKSGKFDTKQGSPSDISLPAGEEPLPDISDFNPHAEEPLPDISDFNPHAEEPLPDISDFNPHAEEPLPDISDFNPHAEEPLPDISDFDPHAEEPLPDISDFNPHATQAQKDLRNVTEMLRTGALDEEGITLNDLTELQRALERAEFRAVEYEIEDYLEKNYPEVKGILIESDGYEYPSFIGVELEDDSTLEDRNYQKVEPLTGRYHDLRNHLTHTYGGYIQSFQDRGSFDEYAEVLYSDEDEYGRFKGLDEFRASEDTPVYRIASRD